MAELEDSHASRGVALREAKIALRRRILATRDAIAPEARARHSAAITQRLLALPSLRTCVRPLLTLSFRTEFDTSALVAATLGAGKEVVLPRVDATARMVVLHRVTDLAREVAPGYLGIPEPLARCPEVSPASIDWVLVPGVAFDRQGGRVGYGGGFYDRLLPLVPRAAPRVAAAYALQLVDAVPRAPHDLAIDVVVTESETLVIAR